MNQSGPLTEVDCQAKWSVNKVEWTVNQIELWTRVDHGLECTIDKSRLQCSLDCGVEHVCPRGS